MADIKGVIIENRGENGAKGIGKQMTLVIRSSGGVDIENENSGNIDYCVSLGSNLG